MTESSEHDYSNYPGRYTVPTKDDPHAGYLPKGPPLADTSKPNVVSFSGASIRDATVVDHTNTPVYYFKSAGERHFEMFNASNNSIGRVEDGKVFYRGSGPVKAKKFLEREAAGNTGAIFYIDGQQYELIQELFYAVVRTIPQCERVAIVYNYTGKLAVEMVNVGLQNTTLQAHLVFTTALWESGVMKGGGGGIIKAIRRRIPERKKREPKT